MLFLRVVRENNHVVKVSRVINIEMIAEHLINISLESYKPLYQAKRADEPFIRSKSSRKRGHLLVAYPHPDPIEGYDHIDLRDLTCLCNHPEGLVDQW